MSRLIQMVLIISAISLIRRMRIVLVSNTRLMMVRIQMTIKNKIKRSDRVYLLVMNIYRV